MNREKARDADLEIIAANASLQNAHHDTERTFRQLKIRGLDWERMSFTHDEHSVLWIVA
jgi:hypothetical protein